MTLNEDTYRQIKREIYSTVVDSRYGLDDSLTNLCELVRRAELAKDYADPTVWEVIRRIRKENGVVVKPGGKRFPSLSARNTNIPEPIFPEYEDINKYFDNFDEGWYKIRKPFELPQKAIKIGIISDIHIANHVRPSLMTALQEIKRQGCDTIILNGDTMDCESLGFWRKRPDKNLWIMEREYGRNFLIGLRKMFPKEKIIWKDGNHELRIQTDVIDKNPAMYGVVTIQNEMELVKHGIDYVEDKQIIKCGELTIIHGHEVRMTSNVVNVARTMFLKTQVNILFGHFHVGQEYDSSDLYKQVHGAWSVGCLCDLSPDYNPYANNWRHGFAIVEKEASGLFTVYNKKIIENQIR